MGVMKHTIDFEVGKSYYIDEKLYGQDDNIVTLVQFFPETMVYGTVRNEETGYEWETMLNRLTEIENE